MPPEPLPWDNRKDFFKEKKQQEQPHDRSSADASVACATARWRDSPYHGSQDFVRGGSTDGRPSVSSSTSTPSASSSFFPVAFDFGILEGRCTILWLCPGRLNFVENFCVVNALCTLAGLHHRFDRQAIRQGSFQVLFPEDSGQGRTRGCSSEKTVEDETCRPSPSYADGRYSRSSRGENKGSSSSQKDWKGHHRHHHSWEASDAPAVNSFGCRQQGVSAQRSVDDLVAYASQHRSDTEISLWDPLHSKDHHDKMSSGDRLVTGNIYDKDLAWRPLPLKWTRSTSLSSRGSGLSNSTSSKSLKVDSDDGRGELVSGKVTPIRSPSGDGGTGVMSSVPFDETSSRKKQRLGWGQGLAKYEKQKVEGPDEVAGKNELLFVPNSCRTLPSNGGSNLADRSPKVMGLSECTSPATPCSVACSSSPVDYEKHCDYSVQDATKMGTWLGFFLEILSAMNNVVVVTANLKLDADFWNHSDFYSVVKGMEERPYSKAANNDVDVSHCSDSPSHDFRSCPEEFSINLENVDANPVKSISSLLAQLLQPEDTTYGDSNFVRSTALNKMRLLKTEFSEALVKTQSEIDSFESELKALDKVSESNVPCPVQSLSLQADSASRPCKVQAESVSNYALEPLVCNDQVEDCAEPKNENIDSPGTVTSKCGEVLALVREVSATEIVKADKGSADLETSTSTALGGKDFIRFYNRRNSSLNRGKDATGINESNTSLCSYSAASIDKGVDSDSLESILASNMDSARKASEMLEKVLSPNQPKFDICQALNTVSCGQNDTCVKEKLSMRKHFQKFKERVLTLKFRAFHHMWKEDMRLLSMRKYRAKSQKRFEPSGRSSHSGHQKHRSSIRSRFTSPAFVELLNMFKYITGNLTLVPTMEIEEFASKLLSDSQVKLYRDSLKMPALILDEEKRHSRFITNNGLVEDPCAVEKERSLINPWTAEEKEVFMDKLATFGKDFTKIASFLSHKTTADCIEFYYKSHKSDGFEKIKERLELRKQGKCFPSNAYLVTSGKKWNREVNAASLDVLGAMVAHADDSSKKTQQASAGRSILGGFYDHKISVRDNVLDGTCSGDIPGIETETEAVAADALASICGGLSSEAMSSCITSSVDPGEGFQEWRSQKIVDRPFTPEVSHYIDEEDTCSDESCGELDSVDWTDEEKATFIMGLRSYGRDFASISCYVRTKSRDQCKIFFSKARKCLGLDLIQPGPDNEGTPTSAASGGRSDSDDACLVEMDSAMCCSTQSCSKMDVDMAPSVAMAKSSEECVAANDLPQPEEISSVKDDGVISNPDESETGRIEESDHGGGNFRQADIKMESSFNDEDKLNKDECLSGVVEEVQQQDAASLDPVLVNKLPVQPNEADSFADRRFVKEETYWEGSYTPEESLPVEGPKGQDQPGACAVDLKQEVHRGLAAEGLKSKSEPQQSPMLETACFNDSVLANGGPSDANDFKSSLGHPVSDTTKNNLSNNLDIEVTACPRLHVAADYQHHMSLELPVSEKKPHVMSWAQNGCCSELPKASKDSSTIIHDYKGQLKQAKQVILNFEEQGNCQHKKSDGVDFQQQYPPVQILKGYPLRLPDNTEANGELPMIGERPVFQSYQKMSRNSPSNQFIFASDAFRDKCNGSKTLHSASSELHFLPRSEKSESHQGPISQSLDKQTECGIELEKQSPGTGDFKLFGKILSNPTVPKKTNCPQNENDDGSSSKSNTSFVTSNYSEGPDGSSVKSKKLQAGSCVSIEEFPMTSYGYWDGNRIQTGFSSLPDSAKYLATISEYSTPMSRIDQRPLSAVVRRNESTLGSLPIFASKDANLNNGALADFQQAYRAIDGSSVQPFSVGDMKRRHDMSELQKRNGFETMLGFQQQSMGVVGMNVMGGSIVVGGCTGVSDPVTAMKMHFATEARFGGGGGGSASGGSVGVAREEESWGRDVGR
ncbi:hypothetical protein ACLOJK_001518 [Asimina triloba]